MSIIETLPIVRFASVGLVVAATVGMSGCISDTDCGVCDPDKLVLESISGINYADRKVHRLTPGVDEGKYFIEEIADCVETPEANGEVSTLNNQRGPEEWCKLSPLVSWTGLEFVFNNLLEPTSIELVRKNPTNPNLFEIYDWKSQLAHIEGPITRYNGDYRALPGESPDTSTRSINLTCVDNLRALGQDFSHEVLDQNPAICEGFYEAGGQQLPLKMQLEGRTESYRGETDWRSYSCAAPDSGPDTCCSVCDYELSVNVAKYGLVGEGGESRGPANALTCDPSGNVYEDCAGFVTGVNREFETNRYVYDWGGEIGEWRLPLSDKIRETHPDLRPAGVEPDGLPCQTDADCDAGLNSDSGAVCVGQTAEGVACQDDVEGCMNKHCQAEWFVGCKDDPNLGGAYCVDRRFKDKGAGACYYATEDFQRCDPETMQCTSFAAGNRIAQCDTGEFPDGNLDAAECCQPGLGAETPGAGCDPLFLPAVTPVPRFDRDRTLPEENRDCYCGDAGSQSEECAALIEQFCTAPFGNLERHDGASNEGAYITRAVTKFGGVIYDPSLKGVLYLPSDRGNQPRSLVETCAEQAQNPDLIEGRNIQDGWRMHDGNFFEKYENFDRGMCSGSEYTVVFATEGEHIVDKVGNTLGDRTTYTFQTPEFHIIPGSGFPTDNLRIGACDDFEIRLSNKYDLDPRNLNKIEIWQIAAADGQDSSGVACSQSLDPTCWELDRKVAGGFECTNDPDEVSASNGEVVPCLTVDVTLQATGSLKVLIDSVRFGAQLYDFDADEPEENVDEYGRAVTGRYRMVIPGLDNAERFADLNLSDPNDLADYTGAFHDICGMPLVTTGGQGYTDFYYDFTIDPPKCKEDPDGDRIPLSCDNSREFPNPDQEDQDLDQFGDISDLCPLTASSTNTADSDRDGVGNDCDTCQEQAGNYNLDEAMLADARMWVRNIPFQSDADEDGIGDVCDNCVQVANCGIFGEDAVPHQVGVPVPFEDSGVCQTDANTDMIGDACAGDELTGAAGPVGFANTDDFDQDGINNLEDYCPRQPIAAQVCDDNTPCADGSVCAATAANDGNRYCNHLDTDNDQVGNACDTCPFDDNYLQVTDNGMQIDDEDGDFVGASCETNASCLIRKDPRPYAFYEVSVNGVCCVTSFPGDGEYGAQNEDGTWECVGLCDPDGFPIKRVCDNEAIPGEDVPDGVKCRQLPGTVSSEPGVVDLPAGCQEALDAAGLCAPKFEGDPDCPFDQANRRLTLGDYPNADELWGKMCFLPQWDQDFDGIGDACDLCPYQYDPFNVAYVDPNTGKLYDTRGKYCFGDYSPDAVCAAEEGEDTGDTGTDTGDESG